MKLAKQFHRLTGERDDVLLAHLHALRRNAPFGALQIELAPLGLAELARSYKDERRELEGAFGRRLSPIAVDGPQQFTDAGRVGNRWMISDDDGRKRAAKVGAHVALGARPVAMA